MDKPLLYKERYTQNRELAWLRFNGRVLNEARDPRVPLLERLRFLSIYANNLNEFFMIRVGGLAALASLKAAPRDTKSGMTVARQLEAIYDYCAKGYLKRDKIYQRIRKDLRKQDIYDLGIGELGKDQRKYVRKYYDEAIAPLLSPLIIDQRHPFPSLMSDAVHVAVVLRQRGHEAYGFVMIPKVLPSVIILPGKKKIRFVHTEEVVEHFAPGLFKDSQVLFSTRICLTRNADIDPDDEAFDDILDYRKKMIRVLGERRRLAVVRLESGAKLPSRLRRYLLARLRIAPQQLFVTGIPLNLRYGFTLAAQIKGRDLAGLVYPPDEQKLSAALDFRYPLFGQILKKDVLLHYPYESMDSFLAVVREAAKSPETESIKITIYRLARDAKLVEYLCEAAENGKEVIVLIELKARFSEQDNIDYSQRLEEAGCTILYGFEHYKVHSKICQITRMHQGKLETITQIGTGNYNENTAKQYTDLAYLTGSRRIARDAAAFFRNMMIGKLDGQYRDLLVAPAQLKGALLGLMDQEIAKGPEGRIYVKANAVTDDDLIRKLQAAARAGTEVVLVIRGICCILPGVPGKTEGLAIHSIVGRYLEHSRIYIFGKGSAARFYISSADFMSRNMERRVEIACPVRDPAIRKYLLGYFELCAADNVQGMALGPTGRYLKIGDGELPVDCQEQLRRQTKASPWPLRHSASSKVITCFKTKYHPKKKAGK